MIGTAILWILYLAIYGLISPLLLLEDVAMDNNITSAVTNASGYISPLTAFIPSTINTLLAILTALIGFEIIIGTYKLIKWVYQKIPFVN